MVLLTGFQRPKRLEDIPGVGGRIAEKLRSYFGDNESAVDAIVACRLSLLAEAVGRAAAVRIVQGLYRYSFGVSPRDVMRTEDAYKLFTKIRGLIARFVASRPGSDILHCIYPLDSRNISEARRRLNLLKRFMEAGCSPGEVEKLRGILRGLEWPKPVKMKKLGRTLVVVADYAAYKRALETLGGLVDVVYAEDPAAVDSIVAEKAEVIVYDPEGLYHGDALRADSLDVASVAPEVVIEYFRVNWKVVEKIYTVITSCPCLPRLLEKLGLEGLVDEKLERQLKYALILKGGDIDPAFDNEYRRLHDALRMIDRVLDETELWANNELQARLERLEVKLSAAQFLRLFSVLREGGEALELPEEIYEVYEEIADEVEKRIAEALSLTPDEAELLKGVAPRTPIYPYMLNREHVEELRSYLRGKLARRRFAILQEIADNVRGLREKVEKLVEALGVVDILAAEHKLVSEGAACIPEVSNGYHGVGFVAALEAGLYGKPSVQRVTYVVGDTPFRPDSVKGERVILLTGANSGGKTTLLQTIGEVSLAAQAGLVVLARQAWVGASDQVYFFSKPTGMVDAGALETTLRILAGIASGRGRRLVLVDELEAATEASAAARIMAVVVKKLCEASEVVAVIVTHLAREILSTVEGVSVKGCLRVDGIEAKGLDENYNLIVDRNPRFYYLARSTPELVVRRLLHRAKTGEEKEFYLELLRLLSTR